MTACAPKADVPKFCNFTKIASLDLNFSTVVCIYIVHSETAYLALIPKYTSIDLDSSLLAVK